MSEDELTDKSQTDQMNISQDTDEGYCPSCDKYIRRGLHRCPSGLRGLRGERLTERDVGVRPSGVEKAQKDKHD